LPLLGDCGSPSEVDLNIATMEPVSDMQLVSSPFTPHFRRFVAELSTDGVICSPYIGREPVEMLLDSVTQRGIAPFFALTLVTDLSVRNTVQGSTDLSAVVRLAEVLPRAQIYYVPQLHAKVYIAGQSLAVVASANFTKGGSSSNLEYGVCFHDHETIARIREDVGSYARLGGKVPLARLRSLRDRTIELRALVAAEQRSINSHLREASSHVERETEDDLIRIRVDGRSVNAVFSDAILYLLKHGPVATKDLGTLIRQVLPDFCDDTRDRVIDGQHYGKLWKHQLRNAQQHLKSNGLIAYDPATRKWFRTA
jgi:hypothetical protein